MPKWDPDTLTDRQRAWFASVRAGLERDTGKSLEAWALAEDSSASGFVRAPEAVLGSRPEFGRSERLTFAR